MVQIKTGGRNMIMNIKTYSALILSAALIACGCSRETVSENGIEVSLAVEEQVTKTVTDFGTGVTRFAEGDAVSVWSAGLAPDMNGVLFAVDAEGTLVQDGKDKMKYKYCGDEGGSFIACSPASGKDNGTTVAFTVPSDQSSAAKFTAADFMTGKASVEAAQAAPVAIKFAHRAALVKVTTAELLEDYGSVAETISLNGVLTSLEWDRASDKVNTVTDSETGSVTMWKAADGLFVAVVPAQEIAAGKIFLTIGTDDGRTFTYKPAAPVSLKEGEVFGLEF